MTKGSLRMKLFIHPILQATTLPPREVRSGTQQEQGQAPWRKVTNWLIPPGCAQVAFWWHQRPFAQESHQLMYVGPYFVFQLKRNAHRPTHSSVLWKQCPSWDSPQTTVSSWQLKPSKRVFWHLRSSSNTGKKYWDSCIVHAHNCYPNAYPTYLTVWLLVVFCKNNS